MRRRLAIRLRAPGTYNPDKLPPMDPALSVRHSRRQRMLLGLAILDATREPGRKHTCAEIAAYCDCTRGAISMIEWAALKKLRDAASHGKFKEAFQP